MSSKSKKDKKRNKLDQLLHIDHSDVYFENERLDTELSRTIDQLSKDFHRVTQQHEVDITDQKDTIVALKAVQSTSEHPLLAPSTNKPRRPRPKHKKKKDSDSEDSWGGDSDSSEDFAYRKPTGKIRSLPNGGREEEEDERQRVARLRRINKSRRKKFPKEWYTSVLPASDVPIPRIRRQQSAPPGARGQKPSTNSNSRAKSSNPFFRTMSTTTLSSRPESAGGLKIICSKPVKPVVMSLRKLKEISYIDNFADRIPNKRAIRQQGLLLATKTRREELDYEVKSFMKTIDEKILKDEEDIKEKETEKDSESMYPDVLIPPDQLPEVPS
ncbi:uncharacterized protein LOC110465394 [Mizuhopecten yessoensis]|uniref:Uncharacterized protein n=1 Tax=Mizuhopecten yessoensis TaxID=6573 RepID=A0A210PRT5_MIZYE|nr:uncharacterized protein LOC110465394 [Mizuhopecten yessoensis]XP_021376847.1 uncharacterized protein LOC110465394 [Mizuhopecten yessoensis]OWF39162.1 hypothetical protein KP79_PYT07165 [Mizuhopecten yessoensis]